MITILVFSGYGKYIDIHHQEEMIDTVLGENRLDSSAQAYLNCLLFSPCTKECEHRQREIVKFRLDENNKSWFVELLILAIRHGDEATKCRAISLSGHVGGERLVYEITRMLSNKLDDVHWTAVESLRRLGHSDLPGEWNYQ